MQKPLDSDDDLIQACRDGNPHAWELLIDRYERLVYSIPLSYDLSREDAADVTQVTFTSLLQSLDMLREDSRLSAWLATVARRQTWQLLARARREDHEEYTELIGAVATLRGDATDALERWEMLQWLHEGLDQLAGRCRALLLALYFESPDLSYAEIANRLGIPVGGIGPTRARCLGRLRHILRSTE
jgi:RNA polymerase sigma factor (sigma-70 family)